MGKEIIESFEFDDEKQTITVIKRVKSGLMYASTRNPVPDSVFKEVYGIKDGRIELLSTQKGKHIPPQTISEQFIFKE